jgi:hypothetical protein
MTFSNRWSIHSQLLYLQCLVFEPWCVPWPSQIDEAPLPTTLFGMGIMGSVRYHMQHRPFRRFYVEVHFDLYIPPSSYVAWMILPSHLRSSCSQEIRSSNIDTWDMASPTISPGATRQANNVAATKYWGAGILGIILLMTVFHWIGKILQRRRPDRAGPLTKATRSVPMHLVLDHR